MELKSFGECIQQEEKKVKFRNIAAMLAAVMMLTANHITALAAQDYQLLQVQTKQERVIAYLEGDAEDAGVECQIGMTACEEVLTEYLSEKAFDFHTIILMDNSLSITEGNRTKAINILREYLDNKNENEYISIAVFGEDIQFLAERTKDMQQLQAAVDSIGQNNQDTYLTDILYDLLDTLDEEEYTRFFIISDGVDNKAIGITKEELTDKLKKETHPVYALGHIYKENEAELENLFALARITNGREFLLDDTEDIPALVKELSDVQKLMRIEVAIPKELQDGSSKSILFTVKSGAEQYEVKAQADMPFSIKEEPEPEPIPEPEPVPKQEEEPVMISEPAEEQEVPEEMVQSEISETADYDNVVSYLAAAVLLVAAFLLIMKKRKDKKGIQQSEQQKVNEQAVEMHIPAALHEKEFVPEDGTVMVEQRYLLVLKDVNDSSRVFKYPLDNTVVIGRNTDKVNIAIDYNLTVSGQHCEFYVRNNRCYVRDLNSSNKTYLNGRVINTETEINSGCMIRFGEVEFSVELIPI